MEELPWIAQKLTFLKNNTVTEIHEFFTSFSVAVRQVIGVTGGRAKIPCDLTPPFPSDEPILILFYKEGYGKPVYR